MSIFDFFANSWSTSVGHPFRDSLAHSTVTTVGGKAETVSLIGCTVVVPGGNHTEWIEWVDL